MQAISVERLGAGRGRCGRAEVARAWPDVAQLLVGVHRWGVLALSDRRLRDVRPGRVYILCWRSIHVIPAALQACTSEFDERALEPRSRGRRDLVVAHSWL